MAIDEKLTISKDEALEYLEDYRLIMSKQYPKRNLKKQFQGEEEEFVNSRYHKAKYQVENWDKLNRITVDESGGRFYSRISGLMSPLRNFLKYDQETLVSFDLKNSQPLHFLFMLKSSFWTKGRSQWSLETLNEELYDYLSKEDISPPIMFNRIVKSYTGKEFEFPNFRSLVEKGKLYEFTCYYFFNMSKTRRNKNKFTTRNKTKKEVLRLMYFNPNEKFSPSHKVFQMFADLFPVEAEVMSLFKERSYRDFPILLQKLEAKVILEEVCRNIFNISSEIPLFTVHDSIITTEKYSKVVKEVFSKTYLDFLGFTPEIKMEILEPENADMDVVKYINSKIDQAEIEELSIQKIRKPGAPRKLLKPLKCECENIENELAEMVKDKVYYVDDIPGMMNFDFLRK